MDKKIIHTVFEDVVKRQPSNIAIETANAAISYSELNNYANRISHLLKSADFKTGMIVNVISHSSIELVASMLSVFKAGGIYLPVDLTFSNKRLEQIFDETYNGFVILTTEFLTPFLELIKRLNIDVPCLVVLDNAQNFKLYNYNQQLEEIQINEKPDWQGDVVLEVSGSDSNYIFYTSGTTGDGKPIAGVNVSLSHFIHWEIKEFSFNKSARVSQLAQITFDASLRDIFVALISGGVLCIPSPDLKSDPSQLLRWIQEANINILHCVPSLFRVLTKELHSDDSYNLDKLNYVFLAGELLYTKDIINWREIVGDKVKLTNFYGATETTLIKTFYRIEELSTNVSTTIPVGVPISNTSVAIIKDGRICKANETGEIFIKTPFATKGYYRNETLTKTCFVSNPLSNDPNDIVYKTGDLGRFLADGNIEVLGRLDSQVKVNGIRVELSEIEKAMLDLENISGVIVKAHRAQDNMISLVAYYTGIEIDPTGFRKPLSAVINSQLIPSYFVYLNEFPLNANGKIDQKALPLPSVMLMGGTNYESPIGKVENILAGFWREILGHETIGRNISFFTIGGHSLRAIQLLSRIHKEFGVSLKIANIFSHNTVAELAILVSKSLPSTFSRIEAVPLAPSYALSSSQRRLWVLSQFDEGSVAYHMSGVYEFTGKLELHGLTQAFSQLIKRHEILRTVFREEESGEVRQYIEAIEEQDFKLNYSVNTPEEHLLKALRQDATRPFELSTGPLLRASVYQLSADRHVFSYTMHHIISDGWSMNILIQELLYYYNSYVEGKQEELRPLRIQYKDYAGWQQRQLNGPSLQAHKDYWLDQFAGELPVLELPTDRLRPLVKTYRGGVVEQILSSELSEGLRTLSQSHGCTLFMSLLAGVNALLYRYTGQGDLIVGSPIAGRDHIELENQIGFYVNTLALRTHIDRESSYRTLLEQTRKTTLEAYEHQLYPFDELVEALNLQHDMSRSALFDVLVVLQNNERKVFGEKGLNGLSICGYGSEDHAVSKFDLTFNFTETRTGIQVRIQYNNDIYEQNTIERLGRHFEQLLQSAVSTPDHPLSTLSYLAASEVDQLLQEFNNIAYGYSEEDTIVSLFEAQVLQTPENIAVVFGESALSYAKLNAESNRFGHFLRQHYGIGPDVLVGIRLERSEWMVIALLGVLKSGGAYVPIDPEYPQERIDYMLSDSISKVVIDEVALTAFRASAADYPGNNPVGVNSSGDLAYVIYTSGSTGQPKGVMVENRNVVRLVKQANYADLNGSTTILSTGAVSFDAITFEIWGALLNGGKLIMCTQEVLLNTNRLSSEVLKNEVNTMWFSTGWFNQLVNTDISIFEKLRTILVGGDKLSAAHIRILRKAYPALKIVNGYGPTENTTFSLTYNITSVDENIPIGKPINNSTAYIMDENGYLQPIGVHGEICVGGMGVSRGYLNKPELTTEKFVQNRYEEGSRVYKTGDLGRWLPDGNIEYLGRKDEQVKIRGYRIELGEIETVLDNHPLITNSIVVAQELQPGDKELIAYLVSEQELNVAELRGFLGIRLPSYMIPSYYVSLERLPLTGNGKIDKRRLPNPLIDGLNTGVEYIAPESITEQKLSVIWGDILGKTEISALDNFFELGGHSLKATRLLGQIAKEFEVKVSLKELFTISVLRDLAALIDRGIKTTFQKIEVVALSKSYALSSSQRRLWILSQFEEGNVAFNIPVAYEFIGQLNLNGLRYAFNQLIERHEILRTVFKEDDSGEIRQYIQKADEIGFSLGYYDFQRLKAVEVQLQNTLEKDSIAPFDLSTGPLLRASVYQVSDNRHIFSYTMHHIISDGWSMNVLIRELLYHYNSYVEGKQAELAPLRIQYKDYAGWQQKQLSGSSLQAHKDYWLGQFAGELPIMQLPTDRPRPVEKTYRGGVIEQILSSELSEGLRTLSNSHGCTLFMSLLAGLNALLYRYTGQKDLIVGSPIAGREHIDLENQIGFYLNTLALRTRFDDDDTFEGLLQKVKKTTLEAYEHQMYPFEELIDRLNLQRDLSRSSLFDVMIVLQNNDRTVLGEESLIGLEMIRGYGEMNHQASKFDLSFYFIEVEDKICLYLEYNSDIYERSTIDRLGGHLEQLLRAVVAAPEQSLSKLNYISDTEKAEILLEFNSTTVSYPEEDTIVSLFEAQVAKTPDSVAVVFGETVLNYSELNTWSNRFGHYLRKHYDIRPDNLVAIRLDRSEWMVIALLGVLKSGGAYVPIDPEYPQERIDYMLSDSGSKVVIDEEALTAFRSESKLYPESNLANVNSTSDLAYVIYTSGSTGQPKGAMVEHMGMLNHMLAMIDQLQLNAESRIAQNASFSFDISVWQLLNALLVGGATIIYSNNDILDTSIFTKKIVKDKINILQVVPSYLKALLDSGDSELKELKELKYLLVTGEAVTDILLKRWFTKYPDIKVVNAYGPAEVSDDVSLYIMDQAPVSSPVSVGKPIQNTRIYILDNVGLPCPIGIKGELYISGAGVGRGYINDPLKTSKSFSIDPFQKDQNIRMYKTGDIGKWLPDGNILFIERNDNQVKIRGYRIELTEIENALRQFPAIEEAVVLAIETSANDKTLVAYVVSREGELPNSGDLRGYLGSRLPGYMVPGYYVSLESLPLTSNGKLDRRRLPDPLVDGLNTGVAYIAPVSITEQKLSSIWSHILEKEQVGLQNNFFELGGHSLKATRLVSQIHKVFEVKLSLKELFTTPVLGDQAALIDKGLKTAFQMIEEVALSTSYGLSSSQRRLWILSQFEEGSVAYNMPGVYEFTGQLDLSGLEYSFTQLIARHEILRTVFREDGGGEVRQYIQTAQVSGFSLGYHDLRGASSPQEHLRDSLLQDGMSAFDLSSGPLLRANVYQLSADRNVFSYTMHHIISDGWSMNVLIRELLYYYNSYVQGVYQDLPALRIHYKDYAGWQQAQLSGPALDAHKNYWLNQFSGELPVLELPSDRVRPSVKTYRGGVVDKMLSTTLSESLRSLSQSQGCTLFMSLLAGVNALLYRYTGQDDLIIGSPIAGREHIDLENQIGFYLNTLALRTQLDSADTFEDLLQKIKKTTLEAYEHQVYPFDELVEELNLQRDMSRSTLFDVMVVLHNTTDFKKLNSGKLHIKQYQGKEQKSSQFDLSFDFIEINGNINLKIEYNSDLFDKTTAEQIAVHYESLLFKLIEEKSKQIQKIDYLTTEEKARILVDFNNTNESNFTDKTFIELFEQQVKNTPESVAFVFNDLSFSYRELNEKANKLGRHLRESYHIKPNDLIGIKLSRNEWAMVSILGVLKSGAAYVPIDPDYPQERIDFIQTDSNCKVLIDQRFIVDFKHVEEGYSGNNLSKINDSQSLMYVIYTSGSTGRPKGVLVKNSNVTNIAFGWIEKYNLMDFQVNLLQIASMSFDVFSGDMCRAFLSGGKMVLCPTDVKLDLANLYELMRRHAVSIFESTPGVIIPLMDYIRRASKAIGFLKILIFGSDTLNIEQYKKVKGELGEHVRIINSYGTTETAIDSTFYEDANDQISLTNYSVPIGKPFPNTQLFILSPSQMVQPVGIVGELFIGGEGVTLGYLNRPELTNDKFVQHPFEPGATLYKTGDLAKWLPDGNVEFISRKDDQVKIRGYRIELGEVESALQAYEGISSVVVAVKTNHVNERELVAYYTGDRDLTFKEISDYMFDRLPYYMTPAYFVKLDNIPLTPNGKVDRTRLLAIDIVTMRLTDQYVSPGNETEEKLVSIWEEVLAKSHIGIKDNFFALGGHSLKLISVISRITEHFGVKIPIEMFFRNPCVEALAKFIEAARVLPEADLETTDELYI